MHVYLKGYYGYKNIGDEILLLGLIDYLHEQLGVTSVTLEAADPAWMKGRIRRHIQHVPIPVDIVAPPKGILARLWMMFRSLIGVFPLLVLGG